MNQWPTPQYEFLMELMADKANKGMIINVRVQIWLLQVFPSGQKNLPNLAGMKRLWRRKRWLEKLPLLQGELDLECCRGIGDEILDKIPEKFGDVLSGLPLPLPLPLHL
ncbi:hypothetical protein AMTR_s00003p00259980 [Amborella trichopoda]|uniref:Uncharacterized protein n=1 Tax=Amborella trichopoda TaxID=13333 RepID=W1P8V0_AMBTC|nr:hypothetical protein AMTR_s00003p00259980 [Amborella trichopoda]